MMTETSILTVWDLWVGSQVVYFLRLCCTGTAWCTFLHFTAQAGYSVAQCHSVPAVLQAQSSSTVSAQHTAGVQNEQR